MLIWIIIIIFALAFGYIIFSENRYSKLEEQYQELLLDQKSIVDSLRNENERKTKEIDKTQASIITLESKIDSLTQIKQKVIRDTFVIANSFSESISLLKSNLECIEF